RHRIASTEGHPHVGRHALCRAGHGGLPAQASHRREAGRQSGTHGPDPPNCTFTAVPFWISTLAPLFWITVEIPAALPKAPPPTMFEPPTVPIAVLPSTLPLLSTSTMTRLVDSPPRRVPSMLPATACPKPSTAAGPSAGDASASAPAMSGITIAGMVDPPCQRGEAPRPCRVRGARPCLTRGRPR